MYISTSGYLPDFNILKSYLFEISVTLSYLNTCFTNNLSRELKLKKIKNHHQETLVNYDVKNLFQ